MKKLLIALLLAVVILGTVAASAKKQPDVFSVWTMVDYGIKPGPCPGLTDHFHPCEGCTVWVHWLIPAPDRIVGPLRLDGYMTDGGYGCQIFNATGLTYCEP